MTVFDRRRLLAAAAALAAPGIMGSRAAQAVEAADALVTDKLTIDMHSHGGGFMHENTIPDPVVDAMRAGGLAVACLAIVSDAPATKLLPDGRIHPIRDPDPGELYAWSRASFARVLRLAQDQGARLIGSTADLRAAPAAGPAVVVAAEGADFLKGRVERVDEARRQFGLRHLQLVHYRPNELGDIQTEAPVHDGLPDFGVEVVRACNRLGIVVDVAHATFDVVKRAAQATSRPLILSHTSLTLGMTWRSRQISSPRSTRWPPEWRNWPKSLASIMSGSVATCGGLSAPPCCRPIALSRCWRRLCWRAGSRRRMPARFSAATTLASSRRRWGEAGEWIDRGNAAGLMPRFAG
jgi:membrane dipeptidase